MPLTVARSPGEPWLDAGTVARLDRRVHEGLRRARSSGTPVLVSVCSAIRSAPDPSAVVAMSRRPDEPWFCFEQPEQDGFALAALGQVRTLERAGPDRCGRVA